MQRPLSWGVGACVFASFLGVSSLQSWPLPLHLSTHLTGQPAGDTGVYVWNTWVFRHRLIDKGQSPFSTTRILPLAGPANLSLHNYTPFANLVAVPVQPLFGVVATFNLIYLLNVALAGFGLFLLAHRVTGCLPESWLAGLFFACAPFLVARSTGHFSLVAAAPLPIFVYWFDRAWESLRVRDAVAAGVCVVWAWACDPYYAVYCVVLGVIVAAGRLLSVTIAHRAAGRFPRVRPALDVACVALGCLIVTVHVLGGGSLRIASLSVSMRTLYTPMLLLTLLVLLRLGLTFRPRILFHSASPLASRARAAAAAVLVSAVLLSPVLIAMGKRVADGRMVSVPVPWRSSAPGVDLLSFFIPNPNHPLAPSGIVRWLDAQPGFFAENVASLSLVALAVIALAWSGGFRPIRWWTTITVGFGLLALGPFIQIAGVNTYVPTPWALLRYVPIIGAARMPPRFSVVALMGTAVIFAMALAWLTAHRPKHRRAVLATVGLLLVFELLPAPRTLYSAEIPAIYGTIAADPRPISVLELPVGVRDGLSSIGNFSASSQYFQTMHGKAIIGGYLSRVSDQRKNFYRRLPVMHALMTLSEGKALTPQMRARAVQFVDDFLDRANLGYVVIDHGRVTPELRRFAIDLLGLKLTAESGAFGLYVPTRASGGAHHRPAPAAGSPVARRPQDARATVIARF